MDSLFEDPWLIVALGLLAEALLGVALWRTRRGALLAAMGVVVVLTGLGLLIERLVVTDREAVEDTLRAAAEAVRAGDEQRVLSFVAPDAEGVREPVQRYLGTIEFTKIVIRAPETQVMQGPRRTARTRFTARVSGRFKGVEQPIAREEAVVFLEVRFRKEGDRWLVTGYEELKSPVGGR